MKWFSTLAGVSFPFLLAVPCSYGQDSSYVEGYAAFGGQGSIVAYYPLETGATDASCNAHDGNVNGGASFEPAKFGMGLKCDGDDDSVTIPSDAAFDNPTGISFCAWVRPERSGSNETILDRDMSFNLKTRENPQGTFTFVVGGTVLEYGTYETDTTYHLCCTYDGQYVKSYVNGSFNSALPRTGNVPAGPMAEITIGEASGAGLEFFQGWIDDVVILDRALLARLSHEGDFSTGNAGL